MGYRVCYMLQIENDPDDLILEALREENEEAKYALTEMGYTNNESKWDSCEDDLKAFSKKYPDRLFTLYGDGSGSDDFSVVYAKNGKAYEAPGEVKYPKFNKQKLRK